MPLITNAEAFRYDFGIYATELWAMTEAQFLEWLNANCDRERPGDMIVRCKDCKWYYTLNGHNHCDLLDIEARDIRPDWFCADGERKEDAKID